MHSAHTERHREGEREKQSQANGGGCIGDCFALERKIQQHSVHDADAYMPHGYEIKFQK